MKRFISTISILALTASFSVSSAVAQQASLEKLETMKGKVTSSPKVKATAPDRKAVIVALMKKKKADLTQADLDFIKQDMAAHPEDYKPAKITNDLILSCSNPEKCPGMGLLKPGTLSSGGGNKIAPIVAAPIIIAGGALLWNVITNGQPVNNARSMFLDVVPQGKSPAQMHGWGYERLNCYDFKVETMFGLTGISARYCVTYIPGGTLDGKDRYLQGVGLYALKSEVSALHSLDMQVTAKPYYRDNYDGSAMGCASLILQITHKDGMFSGSKMGTREFNIYGDGRFDAGYSNF